MTGWDEYSHAEYGIRILYVNGIPVRYEKMYEKWGSKE